MSFVKEYTHLYPEGIWNCLFPEGPKTLKEINCYRFLKLIWIFNANELFNERSPHGSSLRNIYVSQIRPHLFEEKNVLKYLRKFQQPLPQNSELSHHKVNARFDWNQRQLNVSQSWHGETSQELTKCCRCYKLSASGK